MGRRPAEVADADVVLVPGSKATVADLAWLRDRGLADAVVDHADAGKPVLGICGGFQMLCRRIDDRVESRSRRHRRARPARRRRRILSRTRRCGAPTSRCAGYEIHHGRLAPLHRGRLVAASASAAARCTARTGTACSTTTRSAREWLAEAATAAGRDGFVCADDVDVAARRDAQLDTLADLLTAHLDVDAMCELLDLGRRRRPGSARGARAKKNCHDERRRRRRPSASNLSACSGHCR